jgi:hypothetical protein
MAHPITMAFSLGLQPHHFHIRVYLHGVRMKAKNLRARTALTFVTEVSLSDSLQYSAEKILKAVKRTCGNDTRKGLKTL